MKNGAEPKLMRLAFVLSTDLYLKALEETFGDELESMLKASSKEAA